MSIAPTLEAERAALAAFPPSDSPHTLVKMRADADRAAYKAGYLAARRTAAPVAEGVALPPLAAETVRDSTWRNLLDAVLREFPRHMGRGNNGNAPGHCHSRPGIWDDDNGAIAGKPCAWCIAWNGAAQALAAAPSPLPPKEEAK